MTRWLKASVLLGAGAGTGWLGARRAEALGSTETVAGWDTATVGRRDLGATVLATGVVRPKVGAEVAVGSRASGVLERLHVTIGDAVDAGQMLAELDQVEYATAVQRAEAALLDAGAERVYAEGEYRRAQQLAREDVFTPSALAAAKRAAETTRAREQEAAAALEAARVQLSYTRIHAPIGGVIASVSTQEGETVAASFEAPTFLTIVDLDRLEVWAYVDETDIGRVEVGQRARFTVDTYPDEVFEGHVTAVRPSAELRDNVVNYVALIEIEHRPDRILRPEMTATIHIVLDGRDDAVSAPNGALRRDAAGTFVLVPDGDALERRNVQVGFRGSEFSELIDGVEPGERVVLGPTRGCETSAVPEGGT